MKKKTSKSNKRTRGSLSPSSSPSNKVVNIAPEGMQTGKNGDGTLIIIGGREQKTGEMRILREVVKRIGSGKLVVASVASEVAMDVWKDYLKVFTELGVKNIEHLFIERPEDARQNQNLKLFDGATAIFFTGGDQLKITTKLGGTAIADRIFEIFESGGLIAGTSAGASVMGETMLIGGENDESHKVGNWMMAPGFGLMKNIIIDQHFAQRGRIGRLLGAVAMNPGVLGVGIDENTSIVVTGGKFEVVGQNAVYIVDGRGVTHTNISEAAAENTMSIHDVRMHILAQGETFEFKSRRPSSAPI